MGVFVAIGSVKAHENHVQLLLNDSLCTPPPPFTQSYATLNSSMGLGDQGSNSPSLSTFTSFH